VEVDGGPGAPCRLLHVTMDVTALQQHRKPYLGGYRHRQSGATYHHASSQTPQPADSNIARRGAAAATASALTAAAGLVDGGSKPNVQLSRETQTKDTSSTSSQTVREAATQMARPGLELDSSGDR